MTDVTPARAISGLSLAVMLRASSLRAAGTSQNPALPMTPTHLPWSLGDFVRVLAQSSNHLLELAKLSYEPWRINGLMSFSKVALHSKLRCRLFVWEIPQTSRNLCPDVLLGTSRRGRFGRVDMTGSYCCMSSPQRVQYRLPDCHRNADLSPGGFFRLQGYRCVRRRLYLASMPGLGTPFHVSLPNVPSCCHRCPKI